jgi:excisionase family DNA binding protein
MAELALISVQEAAERLGLSAMTVRHHIASGQLPAVKRGGSWWLDARQVERMRRMPSGLGRPLSGEMAWIVILLGSGAEQQAADMAQHDRYISRAKAWAREHPLDLYAPRLRGRASAEAFDAHPAEVRRIAEREDVLRTGASAGEEVGLVGESSDVEVYAPVMRRNAVVEDHALDEGAGAVRIRWVSDGLWPHVVEASTGGRAPRLAVLLDLLESDAPRARREALAQLRS